MKMFVVLKRYELCGICYGVPEAAFPSIELAIDYAKSKLPKCDVSKSRFHGKDVTAIQSSNGMNAYFIQEMDMEMPDGAKCVDNNQSTIVDAWDDKNYFDGIASNDG